MCTNFRELLHLKSVHLSNKDCKRLRTDENQVRLHFTGTFSPHHAGKQRQPDAAWAVAPTLGPNPGSPLATGVPESSFPLLRFQLSPRPLPHRSDPLAASAMQIRSSLTPRTHTRCYRTPGGQKDQGEGEREEEQTLPGPARPGTHLQAASPGAAVPAPRPRRRRV